MKLCREGRFPKKKWKNSEIEKDLFFTGIWFPKKTFEYLILATPPVGHLVFSLDTQHAS